MLTIGAIVSIVILIIVSFVILMPLATVRVPVASSNSTNPNPGTQNIPNNETIIGVLTSIFAFIGFVLIACLGSVCCINYKR